MQEAGFYKRSQLWASLHIGFTPTCYVTDKAAYYRCPCIYRDTQKKAAIPERNIFACINMHQPYLGSISLQIMPAPNDDGKFFIVHHILACTVRCNTRTEWRDVPFSYLLVLANLTIKEDYHEWLHFRCIFAALVEEGSLVSNF